MSKLSERAKQVVGGCELMQNREKMETPIDEMVTVIAVDLISGKDGEFAVFLTKEDEKHFYFGGQAMTELTKEILADAELVKDLHTYGLKMKFHKTKTRSGRDFTSLEVFD